MKDSILKYVEEEFDKNALPSLMDLMRIPNISPGLDPSWETNGNAQKACDHLVNWIEAQNLVGCKVEVIKDPGKTHLIFVEIDATEKCAKTVLMYAHWDKMPPLEGKWSEGLGPYAPVVKDGLLYGRGAADDSYATYAAVLSIKACQAHKLAHPRIVMVLESAEETGDDLNYYLPKITSSKLKKVDAVVCLDSDSADDKRLWITTSLRGVFDFNLNVKVLKDGVHSGDAGGIVPESFRVCRMLLERLENSKTGILDDAFQVEIPKSRIEEAKKLCDLFKDSLYKELPFVPGAKPQSSDLVEMALNKTWRPSLAILGAAGLPSISTAGNVLRPSTTLKVSIRLPPTLKASYTAEKVKELITTNPPYGCEVTMTDLDPCNGWNANEFSPKFSNALHVISKDFFGEEYGSIGIGGSIPFVGTLADIYPNALFIVSGAASPTCNEHAPDENLDIVYTKKFISALAAIIHQLFIQ